MAEIDVRKGMPSARIDKEEFVRRYRARFVDPAFESQETQLSAIIEAAWDAYSHSRKSPRTRKAGPQFSDPNYDLAADWISARREIIDAQRRHDNPAGKPRMLLINGSSRSEHTCPGEMSKSWRLLKPAEQVFLAERFDVDILDLSRLTQRVRQADPSLQIVRINGDAFVSLAMQLLPKLLPRPNRRLDERDLPDVGSCTWCHDHYTS